MVKLNEFVPQAPNLNPKPSFSLKGFLINSNGVLDTKITDNNGTTTRYLNRKTAVIDEAARSAKWDVIHITEKHETPLEGTSPTGTGLNPRPWGAKYTEQPQHLERGKSYSRMPTTTFRQLNYRSKGKPFGL